MVCRNGQNSGRQNKCSEECDKNIYGELRVSKHRWSCWRSKWSVRMECTRCSRNLIGGKSVALLFLSIISASKTEVWMQFQLKARDRCACSNIDWGILYSSSGVLTFIGMKWIFIDLQKIDIETNSTEKSVYARQSVCQIIIGHQFVWDSSRTIKCITCFLMHDQLVINKIKTVWLGFIRMFDHFLY